MKGDFRTVILQPRQKCGELRLGIRPVSIPPALEKIVDVILAYRPKSKQPKPRKRKKAKR